MMQKYPRVVIVGAGFGGLQTARSLSWLTIVAPLALQQGVYVVNTIGKQIRDKKVKPFNYFDKGRLAIISCDWGIGQIAGFKLKGFIPWFFLLDVHVVYFPN